MKRSQRLVLCVDYGISTVFRPRSEKAWAERLMFIKKRPHHPPSRAFMGGRLFMNSQITTQKVPISGRKRRQLSIPAHSKSGVLWARKQKQDIPAHTISKPWAEKLEMKNLAHQNLLQ